jgi:EpsI family protein
MTTRLLTIAACVALVGWYLSLAPDAEAVPTRQPLSGLPLTLGEWQGIVHEPFAPRILEELGVDDYASRTYRRADEPAIGLYVGFYYSQRQGDTIHSPLNCLPGAGWIPTRQERIPIEVEASPGGDQRTILVNRVTIQRGLDRQVVLYWYQSHGRVIASEYWGKIYTVLDAVRMNRTDLPAYLPN